MPQHVDQYRVLIASPSDLEEDRKAMEAAILSWNTGHTSDYGVTLQPVRWERDATPEMGGGPQGVLNRQLVDTCDIVIAAFWTRIGTGTEEFQSGTEEEIERALRAGKHVLLYFSSAPVDPEVIDPDQLRGRNELKQRYLQKGIVGGYSSIEELRERLQGDITRTISGIRRASLPRLDEVERQSEEARSTEGPQRPQMEDVSPAESVFTDDFRNSLVANWECEDTWRIPEEGTLLVTGSDPVSPGGITKVGAEWGNYTVEFQASKRRDLGVIVRAHDLNNYYMLQITRDHIVPHRRLAGQWDPWHDRKEEHRLMLYDWFAVRVKVQGQCVRMWIDDKPVYQRESFLVIPKGRVGFRCAFDEEALIRQFRVTLEP